MHLTSDFAFGIRPRSNRTACMPQISNDILQSSIYLYANEADAHSGRETGGSGFLVGVESAMPGNFFGHAITNSHVARSFPVARIVDRTGTTVVRSFAFDDWIHADDGTDLAVALMVNREG